jgi:DNA-binding NtrC family response regulator
MSGSDDRTAAAAPAVRFALPALIRVIGAKAMPSHRRLTHGSCIVGASATADVVVTDPEVSRRHVELSLVPEGIHVTDLGSRNGTFYLGQRVERMTLALGSRLRIGSAELVLDVDPDALADEDGAATAYRGLLGASAAMRKLFSLLVRLEGSLVNVLIEGESGVGKELVASALHRGSSLAAAPFVALNCGALSRELIASELFGHVRGAFTGALDARKGAFERAHGGTLFLDEIGELPLDVQPMLLRVLEAGELTPVGGNSSTKVKVRVLAATNRHLPDAVSDGSFREDLFFRLAVVTLRIPALRERMDDIALLASSFATSEGVGKLPDELIGELSGRLWPGNVRELKNAIRAYAALGDLPEQRRTPHHDALDDALAQVVDASRPYAEQKDEVALRFTKIYLDHLLRRTGGNQTDAARIAGLDRGYLGKLLARHGLKR